MLSSSLPYAGVAKTKEEIDLRKIDMIFKIDIINSDETLGCLH